MKSSRLALFTCLLFSLAPLANAACLPIDLAPTFQEEVNAADFVALVQLKEPPELMKLPCGIQVYGEPNIGYIITEELPVYEIIEVFKGSSSETEIPIVYWTDTGYRVDIPEFLTDDSQGFLAVMRTFTTCQNETNVWIYGPDEYSQGNLPYEISSCQYGNQRWSDVSDENEEWLRQLASQAATTLAPAVQETTVSPPTLVILPPEPDPTQSQASETSAPTVQETTDSPPTLVTPFPTYEVIVPPTSIPIPVVEAPNMPSSVPSMTNVPSTTTQVESFVPTLTGSLGTSFVPTVTEVPTTIAEASLEQDEQVTSDGSGVFRMWTSSVLAVAVVFIIV